MYAGSKEVSSVARFHVLGETLKQRGKPRVPLVPVMTTLNCVKFVPEMTLGEERSEFTIDRQQALLFSAGQKEVRC